jgi:hypothetical protein
MYFSDSRVSNLPGEHRSTEVQNTSSYNLAFTLQVARKMCVSLGWWMVSIGILRSVYLDYL